VSAFVCLQSLKSLADCTGTIMNNTPCANWSKNAEVMFANPKILDKYVAKHVQSCSAFTNDCEKSALSGVKCKQCFRNHACTTNCKKKHVLFFSLQDQMPPLLKHQHRSKSKTRTCSSWRTKKSWMCKKSGPLTTLTRKKITSNC